MPLRTQGRAPIGARLVAVLAVAYRPGTGALAVADAPGIAT
ncbi:hypothetical protein [Nocardia abscessus]|nr:hypothetical protein [Nocardia abscessus]